MSEYEVTMDDSSSGAANPSSNTPQEGQITQANEPANNTVTNEPSSTTPTVVTKQPEGKPAGYDPVDVNTATPEQLNDRIKYLYTQVKTSERTGKEAQRILAEQARLIDELSRSQNLVINHLQDKNLGDTEAQLNQIMREAWQRGDEKTYNEAQSKLMDIKIEKRELTKQNNAQQARPVQPQYQQQNDGYNNVGDIANRAMAEGEINEAESRITSAWESEQDDYGNKLRPWTSSNHPLFQSALREGQAIWSNPQYANLSFEQKLAEVDRRMGTVKKAGAQNVMGGSLQAPRKSTRVILSPDIERMVTRTKWGGDKYKSTDERLSAYAKQIATVRQGVRK